MRCRGPGVPANEGEGWAYSEQQTLKDTCARAEGIAGPGQEAWRVAGPCPEGEEGRGTLGGPDSFKGKGREVGREREAPGTAPGSAGFPG